MIRLQRMPRQAASIAHSDSPTDACAMQTDGTELRTFNLRLDGGGGHTVVCELCTCLCGGVGELLVCVVRLSACAFLIGLACECVVIMVGLPKHASTHQHTTSIYTIHEFLHRIAVKLNFITVQLSTCSDATAHRCQQTNMFTAAPSPHEKRFNPTSSPHHRIISHGIARSQSYAKLMRNIT